MINCLFRISINKIGLQKKLYNLFDSKHSSISFADRKKAFNCTHKIMYLKIQKSLFRTLFAVFFVTATAVAQDAVPAADAAPVAATAAAPAATEGDAVLGEKLYKNNCAQCHALDNAVVVGPGLKGIQERRDYPWLRKWINNPNAVIASGDDYAVKLYEKYNKAQMTAFPSFGDAEIKGILAYIDAANVPVVAAVPVAGVAVASGETGGGQFFNVVLIALLGIMALVLVALLAIIQLLTKLAGAETPETTGMSISERFKENLRGLVVNKTIRSAVIWMFILLATKASLDGLYGIGVHQGYAPEQPIAFSHKLHVGEYEINCAYCHTGVYKGKQAGIPSANICMNCHNMIKRESPEIQKIYTALENDQPIEWIRVHNLPDLAYFNHAQHTNVGGLDCTNCHGEIPTMEVVQQAKSLTMGWCIDCHRQTNVNGKDNAYYDQLMEAHYKTSEGPMKVEDIGGLECARCHY
jgi:mono/diheme cytochrome c family protein